MPTVFENSFLSEENSFSEKKSASWVKENMIESPTKRALAEIQLRVQRATERLEIPDWYLNKKSKAPKILKYSTSTDYREPSWKRGVKPEKKSTNSPKDTTDPTGVYKVSTEQKTSMNESLPSRSYGTTKMLEKSTNENNSSSTVYKIPEVNKSGMENPEPIKIVESGATGPKINKTFIKSPRPSSVLLNKSSTFPKISPSRKLKNINIVFPPTKTSLKPDLPKSNPPSLPLKGYFEKVQNSNLISEVNKSNLSCEINKSGQIENSFENMLSGDEKFNTPRKIKMNTTSCLNSSFVNAISPKPFSKKVDKPIASPAFDFNIPANSTSMGTEPTVFTSALDKLTPSKTSASHENTEHVSNFSRDSVTTSKSLLNRNFLKLFKGSEKKHKTYWLGEVKPFGPDCPKTCQECGAKTPRIFAAVTTSSPENANQVIKDKLLSRKYEKTQGASASQTTSSASATNNENVEEKEIQYGDNLAEEIIQGLKEKCKLKNSNGFLGTRYFVKRLVNDLGGEDLLEVSSEEEVELESTDSDRELNSVGSLSSISMSFKTSEPGSHCGIVTSTLKSNVAKSSIKKNKKLVKTDSAPSEDKGVYWIPMKMPNLPRTSTLMSSKPKRSGSKTDSPCISPISPLSDINRADEKIYQKFYGILDSKPKVTTKKFLNTDKGGVLDSGYSDRSNANANKSATSLNYSFSDEPWDKNRAFKAPTCITITPNRSRVF